MIDFCSAVEMCSIIADGNQGIVHQFNIFNCNRNIGQTTSSGVRVEKKLRTGLKL